MIPKLQTRGKSFQGLATYLTHDPKAETDDRVAWTHTLNLAHDHVPSAVDEMLWTARAAELLKQEAGIRAGGRASESPVKHFSLNWSPEDDPSREEMTKAAEDFLRHMKWQDHQALLVAHNDKEYAHIHVLLNAVHPETGLTLDESFERRRAQEWALEYEREHGKIYCEQRLRNHEDREDAPTRPAWMAFQAHQKEFERAEKSLSENVVEYSDGRKNPKIANFEEWKILKEIQKRERLEFFADGKSEFSDLRRSIYREVREEFRERWADFYAAQKNGEDPNSLASTKAELLAEQKAILESRRDEACQELRETRDGVYRDLLADQRDMRRGLRSRQEAGLDNALFLRLVEERGTETDISASFREAADVVTTRQTEERGEPASAYTFPPGRDNSRMKSGPDIGADIATGLGFGVLSIFESIADGLMGAKPAPKPRRSEPEPPGPDLFAAAADEARKRQQLEREEADSEWRKRQRSLYGE